MTDATTPTQEQVDAETVTFDVVFLSPSALKPYANNAKKHSRRQVTLLAKAMRTVGFDQPIVVDANHVIIKGHGRRLAALELKMDLVPVVVRADLTPEQCMASRLADNAAHTMSEVNIAKERSELADYAANGGTDGAVYFDFMTPPKASQLDMPGATAPTPKAGPGITGSLLNCSKCGHTFLEAKK